MSKETSDEYIETKPEAVKAIFQKVGRVLIAWKLDHDRTEEIDGYLEDDELEYDSTSILYILKCEMCEDIGERLDILAKHKKKSY